MAFALSPWLLSPLVLSLTQASLPGKPIAAVRSAPAHCYNNAQLIIEGNAHS
jgi:hypothetical protein